MSTDEIPVRSKAEDRDSDLGFGSVVARESRQRLLNRDGSFNVRREGLPLLQSVSLYHYFLTITWPQLFLWLVGAYVASNAVFALAYMACGEDALSGFLHQSPVAKFDTAFFFSVHTMATIGYGSIAPQTNAANVLVTIEALVGLVAFAFVAGIIFARFSRPTAQIGFSRNAIIAPYHGGRALMFRIVNRRTNEVVELQAKVLLARRRADAATSDREFLQLTLERDHVAFFPLTWTVVHPIDETSPLYGCDERSLRALDPEVLVMLNGFDETFSQTVHARSSYSASEIVWGARFRTVFNPPDERRTVSVDIRKLDDFERVDLP